MDLKKESLYEILDLIGEPAVLIDEQGKIMFENKSAGKFCSSHFIGEKEQECFSLAEKILLTGKNEGELKIIDEPDELNISFKIVKFHGFAFIVFSEIDKILEKLNKKLDESYTQLESVNEELASAEEILKNQIEELNKKHIQLAKSEERYRALSESAMEMIFIVDEKYCVQYVNSFGASTLKSSKENVVGNNLRHLFPFDEYKHMSETVKKVINEKNPLYIERVSSFPDGEMWLGTRLVPLFNVDGTVTSVMGISRDISENKRIEIDNVIVNERFGKVFKHNPLTILISKADDGIIIDVNDSCMQIFGYTPDELLGKPMHILFEKPDERAIFVDKLMTEGPQTNFELQVKRKSGEKRTVVISADYLEINEERCVLSIIQDVTEETVANNTREVLFDIADSAFRVKDLSSLYPEIHKSLRKILNADNFYIAVYNKSTDIIDFPYYHDEKDEYAPSKKFGNGLTEFALKNKKPILLSSEEIKKMAEERTVDLIGTLPVQWMGVPLLGETFTGVVAVQHYDENYKYTVNDRNILYFVSKQISRALENKVKEEQLFQSEIKHRMLLDSINYPILALKEDMSIYYCNQAYADFVGKRIDELESKHLLDVFPSFENTKSYAAFLKCIKTGKNQEVEGEIKGRGIRINAKISRTAWGILSIGEYSNI